MNNQISVENLSPVIHNQVPVITTELLAQLYGTEANNIKVNFSRNAGRFVCGKHYFKLEGAELRGFKNKVAQSNLVAARAKHLTLWTERGAARHAKMLETDRAWEIFEKLEDCYFNRQLANYPRNVEVLGDLVGTAHEELSPADKAKMVAQQMANSMMPAIMDALQVQQHTYHYPMKPHYQDHIHTAEGVLGLTRQSHIMALLRELQQNGNDVSAAMAELAAMMSYITGANRCLRDIQTHAEYITKQTVTH